MTHTPKVYSAINAVMAQMASEGIAKGRSNQQQGYKFRGIDDVYNALARVLANNNLVMLPFVQKVEREEHLAKNGQPLNYTILTVDFKLVSSDDGSTDTIRTVGEAMDSADKSANKAMSAALKYAALQVFMIPTEGDNDADATTHDPAPRQSMARKSSAQAKKDGDHERILALIQSHTSEDVLDMWVRQRFDAETRDLPYSWLDPLRNEVEKHRETIRSGDFRQAPDGSVSGRHANDQAA